MSETAHPSGTMTPSDGVAMRAPRTAVAVAVAPQATLCPIDDVSEDAWLTLAECAAEPNGYYVHEWLTAVSASARGRTGASALCAWDKSASRPHLSALMPAISLWRAYHLPLPALVSADPYGTLGTPLIDRADPVAAVAALLEEARNNGMRALLLRDMTVEGPVADAFRAALVEQGLAPHIIQSHRRACLDATRDPEELLRDALGAKKLKELRRQRNRLGEMGDVAFVISRTPDEVGRMLDTFLVLESSGWKAKRGTALIQHSGDTAFIRHAAVELAALGQCEIVTLTAGTTPVAAAVVLRHQDRAFYFKLGVDERFAKFSPGVQLTLELTRYLCADPDIATVDSTAIPGHPMIDPIWRGRLAIGDMLIPLRRNDPVFALIRAGIALRRAVREPARHLIRTLRHLKEKRQ